MNADGSAARPLPASFAELIDPLLRMKLELSGLTLADAETLSIETAERTERSTTRRRGSTATTTSTTEKSTVPTLAGLPRKEQRAIAASLRLQGMAVSTLRIQRAPSGQLSFALTLELTTLPEGRLVLRARCFEPYEFPEETATVLANCIGNGVLAVRAPDALVGRQQ